MAAYRPAWLQMCLEFERLRQLGCSFLVAGRRDSVTGAFLGMEDVAVPGELQVRLQGLPTSPDQH
jgi:hypothetical protein